MSKLLPQCAQAMLFLLGSNIPAPLTYSGSLSESLGNFLIKQSEIQKSCTVLQHRDTFLFLIMSLRPLWMSSSFVFLNRTLGLAVVLLGSRGDRRCQKWGEECITGTKRELFR